MTVQERETNPFKYASQDPDYRTPLHLLPPAWQVACREAQAILPVPCQELRIRVNQTISLIYGYGQQLKLPLQASMNDIAYIIDKVSAGSLYAFEEEMRQGYITLPGGHRLGFSGQAVVKGGELQRIKCFNSLNLRFARAYPGCAHKIIPHLWDRQRQQLYHTLLISPPRGGKTTLLREIARVLSYGSSQERIPPHQVAIVDERSEIAGCYQGVPQFDVGPNTDVLDACPKVSGVMLMVRAMAPQVVVVDELGSSRDIEAIAEISQAGVRLVATAHASDFQQLSRRPLFIKLIQEGFFERYVVLGATGAIAQITALLDAAGRDIMRWYPSC